MLTGNRCFLIAAINTLLNNPVLVEYVDNLSIMYERQMWAHNIEQEMQVYQLCRQRDACLEDVFVAFVSLLKQTRAQNGLFDQDRQWEHALMVACKAYGSSIGNGEQHDVDEFLRLFFSALEYVSVLLGRESAFWSTFYLTSKTLIDGAWREEREATLLITPQSLKFEDVIDKYTKPVEKSTRAYGSLPIVLTATNDRNRSTGAANFCQFPDKFVITEHSQHDRVSYGFSSAILHIGESLDTGHYVSAIRRANIVYIIDDNKVIGRFHLHNISKYLSQVL